MCLIGLLCVVQNSIIVAVGSVTAVLHYFYTRVTTRNAHAHAKCHTARRLPLLLLCLFDLHESNPKWGANEQNNRQVGVYELHEDRTGNK